MCKHVHDWTAMAINIYKHTHTHMLKESKWIMCQAHATTLYWWNFVINGCQKRYLNIIIECDLLFRLKLDYHSSPAYDQMINHPYVPWLICNWSSKLYWLGLRTRYQNGDKYCKEILQRF